jgi:SAM-dependent methyltransferase
MPIHATTWRRLRTAVARVRNKLRASASPPRSEWAEWILQFCSRPPEAHQYAQYHLGRLVRTLELTPPGSSQDRILEMGAYMQITPALAKKLQYGEVRGCYLGPLGESHTKTVTSTTGETFSCGIDLFNAERDRFPYTDGHFSAVICCELLEHLHDDPMHMMSEVNRILRPRGYLVLSTPNTCALRSVAAVLAGKHPAFNSYYTARKGGNAVEPRHAREYTPREVRDLFEAAGFAVDHLETGPYGLERPAEYDWTLELLRTRGLSTELRDDVIHAVGKKAGKVKERFPDWLYA